MSLFAALLALALLAAAGGAIVWLLARAQRAGREREAGSERHLRQILDQTYHAFISIDELGRITAWNNAAEAMFGWSAEEVMGAELAQKIIPERFREPHRRGLARMLATGESRVLDKTLELAALQRGGGEIPIELTISQTDGGESDQSFHAFIQDISDRKRFESYREAQYEVTRILASAPGVEEAAPQVLKALAEALDWDAGGFWTIEDAERGRITCKSFWCRPNRERDEFERASRTTSLAPGDGLPGRVWMSGKSAWIEDVLGDDGFPRKAAAAATGLRGAIAVPIVDRDEVLAVIELFAAELRPPDEELLATFDSLGKAFGQFLRRSSTERALREAEERFRRGFEDSGVGMAIVGTQPGALDRFISVNDALCELTGYTRERLVEIKASMLTHPDDLPARATYLAALLAGDVPSVQAEERLLNAAGEVIWVLCSTSLVHDPTSVPLYRILQLQDVSERKQFEGQLRHLADHDALTGLFNRRRFGEELTREIAMAKRYRTGGSVLMLDLDNFKYVNDSLGHAAGDALILRAAEMLRGRLRSTDVLARLGGDEFAVILPHADLAQACEIADELADTVRSASSVPAEGGERRMTVSIGVSTFDPEGKASAEDLLMRADVAMYDAKDEGRDRYCVYDVEGGRHERMSARLTWFDRIRDALEVDGFVLHAQPVLAICEDPQPRYELLLRMLGDDGDLVPPGTFLYVAERFELIGEIDKWVIGNAIRLLAERQRNGEDPCFHVNLSGRSAGDPELIALIARELDDAGADPSGLVLEVTETAAIVHVERAKEFAGELHRLGCGFALDDFGAGFASFYYLKHLDFDMLKIDGEFIRGLTTSATNQLVVRSIVEIARGLGKQTLAEFAGDQATIDLLREIGVDYAQGHFIGEAALLPDVLSAAVTPRRTPALGGARRNRVPSPVPSGNEANLGVNEKDGIA